MESDAKNGVEESDSDGEIMGSIDDSGAVARFVIADTALDDAWLSIQATEAPSLRDWR